jgi:hypothetical protein
MSQSFTISNTTSDISHIGPLVQELSLDISACISIDQTLPTNTGDQPLTIAAIKQASLGSSVTIRADPAGVNQQNLTLNLPAGGAAGTIAQALVSELGLLRQNDGVTIDFVVYTPTSAPIELTSDEPNIIGLPLVLYPNGTDGISTVGIELAMVGTETTPPIVRLVQKSCCGFSCNLDAQHLFLRVVENQEIPAGGSQQINFTEVVSGSLPGYTAPGLFTAPEDGMYSFSVNLIWSSLSLGNFFTQGIIRRGTNVDPDDKHREYSQQNFSGTAVAYSLSATMFLTEGDVITLRAQTSTTRSLLGTEQGFFASTICDIVQHAHCVN